MKNITYYYTIIGSSHRPRQLVHRVRWIKCEHDVCYYILWYIVLRLSVRIVMDKQNAFDFFPSLCSMHLRAASN